MYLNKFNKFVWEKKKMNTIQKLETELYFPDFIWYFFPQQNKIMTQTSSELDA